MKIIAIRDIIKKDSPLHYRNEYTANLCYESMTKHQITKNISFTIEKDPLGKSSIHVHFHGITEYPLIPARKRITEYIQDMAGRGEIR